MGEVTDAISSEIASVCEAGTTGLGLGGVGRGEPAGQAIGDGIGMKAVMVGEDRRNQITQSLTTRQSLEPGGPRGPRDAPALLTTGESLHGPEDRRESPL